MPEPVWRKPAERNPATDSRGGRTIPRRALGRTVGALSGTRNATADNESSAMELMDRIHDAPRPPRYWPREMDE